MSPYVLNPHRFGQGGDGSSLAPALLNNLSTLGVSSGDDEAFKQWVASNHKSGMAWTVIRAEADEIRLYLQAANPITLHAWWGDGTTDDIEVPGSSGNRREWWHNYSGGGNHGVVLLGDLTYIRDNFTGNHSWTTRTSFLPSTLDYLYTSDHVTLDGAVADLPRNLSYLRLRGTGVLTGEVADLPRQLTTLLLSGGTTIGGDVAGLPPNLEELSLSGNNSLSGDVADLPRSMFHLNAHGGNTITGDVADLPPVMTYLSLGGETTLSGDAAGLPRELTHLYLTGLNTVSGDVADLPQDLGNLNVGGANTLSGDVADLPAGLTSLDISGNNTVSGTALSLPRGLTNLVLSGNSNLSGVTSDLPTDLTRLSLSGNHTIGGGTAGLPRGITILYLAGANTVSGTVADLPTTLTGQVLLSGNNTISGDVADLPSGLTSISLAGSNTIGGDLSDLPAGTEDLYMLKAGGGTVTLTTPSLPTGLSSVYLRNLPDNSHVDNFLQAMWDNRDQPKPRSTRSITVNGPDVGNPSNQQLIDDLKAYRSPNNDSQYPTWTVVTNPVLIPASDIEIVGWSKSNLSLSNRTTHTHTHTYTATEQDGNLLLLVLLMGNDGDEDIAGGTPDPKVTFIQASNYVDAGITWASYYVPDQASLNSGSVTFEFVTPSAEVFQIVVIELSPVDTTDPIAESKWHSASGSTSTMGPESYTVPEGGMVVATTVPYGDGGTGQTVSLGTANGFELLFSLPNPGEGGNALAVAYRAVPDGGVISGPVWSLPGQDGQAGVGVVFNPGEGGGTIPPTGGDPDVVTAFTDTEETYINSGTSINKAVPSFEVGDVFFASVMHRSTLTPPAGWTLVKTQLEGGGSAANQSLSVYYRVAQAGDTTFTWTQASAERMGVQYVVARSTTGAIDIESIASMGSSGTTENYYHPMPEVTTTVPGSRVMVFSACVYSSSSPYMYAEPEGWDRHGALVESNNRMVTVSKLIPEPATVGGPSQEGMAHNAWDVHSGSEIALVLAPAEGGTPLPEEFFHTVELETLADGVSFKVTADAGAHGGEVAEALVNGDGSVTLSTTVNVPEQLDLKLWVREWAPDGNSDAFYAGINENIVRRYPATTYGAWVWIEVTQATLDAGTHTLSIGPGEAGARLDIMVLCKADLTPGQIDARLGGPPTDPDPPPDPDPPADPGDLNLIGNPDFDNNNPTWWDGTAITGAALQLYQGLRWWADPAHWSSHRDGSVNSFADDDDLYSLARELRDRLQQMMFGLVLTKNLEFLDAIVTAMNITKQNLKVGYRGHDTSVVTWSASPFRCWVTTGGGQPASLYGTDLSRLNEVAWHAFIWQYTAALKANMGFTSPGDFNYGSEYNYWRDYLVNEWLPKWQGGGTSGWRDNYRGIRRTPTYSHPYRRALAGEWPPVIAGNDVHSNISSMWSAYYAQDMVPSQAAAAAAELEWTLTTWRDIDTDMVSGNRLWAQTSKANGSTARYAMASAYPGYVCGDMVMGYLLQVFPSVINEQLLSDMAGTMNDWFFTGDLSSSSTSFDGASMGDIAGEVLRGDMKSVNPQARRRMSSLVLKPYAILARWGGSTINATNDFMRGLSWTGTTTQPTTPFPYTTELLKFAPMPT